MSPDWLTAGKAGNSLVDNCLKNRGRKILFCSALVDQRLDVCFGKNTAAGRDRIKGFIVFCVFVQSRSICLKKGCLLYTSTGEIVGTDITAQAEQVMENVKAILDEAGTCFENVVKTTCFLSDMADFAEFNKVYEKYFVSKQMCIRDRGDRD